MTLLTVYFLAMIFASIAIQESQASPHMYQMLAKQRQTQEEVKPCKVKEFSKACMLQYLEPWGEVGNLLFKEFEAILIQIGADQSQFDHLSEDPNGQQAHRKKRQAGPQQVKHESFMYANFNYFQAASFIPMDFEKGCDFVHKKDEIKDCIASHISGCHEMYIHLAQQIFDELTGKMSPYCQPGCDNYKEDAAAVDRCFLPLGKMVRQFGQNQPSPRQLKRFCTSLIVQIPCFEALDSNCEQIQLGRLHFFFNAMQNLNASCAAEGYDITYNNPHDKKFLEKEGDPVTTTVHATTGEAETTTGITESPQEAATSPDRSATIPDDSADQEASITHSTQGASDERTKSSDAKDAASALPDQPADEGLSEETNDEGSTSMEVTTQDDVTHTTKKSTTEELTPLSRGDDNTTVTATDVNKLADVSEEDKKKSSEDNDVEDDGDLDSKEHKDQKKENKEGIVDDDDDEIMI